MQWQAEAELQNASQKFKAFIGLSENDTIILIIPKEIPTMQLSSDLILQQAIKNSPKIVRFERLKAEAEKNIEQAKSDKGLNANFVATFGLTNSGTTLPNLYRDPIGQQTLSMGFNVPILDWGRGKSRIERAKANKNLTNHTINQESINFKQEILSQIRQLRALKKQLEIAIESELIATERYGLSKERYAKGTVTITELNISLQEKDNAQNAFINSLQEF